MRKVALFSCNIKEYANFCHFQPIWGYGHLGMSSFMNLFIESYLGRIFVPLDINNDPKYFSRILIFKCVHNYIIG